MKMILIADDDQDVRAVICMRLANNRDVRIVEATNGREVLALAQKGRPDLVVLDWSMPGMSGLEVMQEFRKDPATADIPVIMMTGRDDPSEQAQARALGVSAYLVKPFDPAELQEKIERVLSEPG